MLNYLNAELYKLRHDRMTWVTYLLLALLELLFLAGLWLTESRDWRLAELVSILPPMLFLGFFLLIFPASIAFSEQHKHRTLKNELNFGIPRTRIYLGKLFTSLLAAGAACLVLLMIWLGCAALLFDGWAEREELILHLSELGQALGTALPLWLGALGLFHALQFTVKNTTVATVLYIAYFIVIEPVGAAVVGLGGEHRAGVFFQIFNRGLLSTLLTGTEMGWAWLVGLGWLAASTAVGLILFLGQDVQ